MVSLWFKQRGRRMSLAMVWLWSLVMLSLLLAACGSGGTTSTSPPTLITPGVLTVGSDLTYPPQEYLDPTTNKAAGFDIDLITAMAQRMSLRATILPARFATLLDDLAAKRFDVVVSAVTITSARRQQVDFVPYFTAGESLLVQPGNPKHIQSTDDLCGLAVGVQEGTIEQGVLQSSSDNCQEQEKPAITLLARHDQTAVIQLLAQSRVVATYQDSPVTDYCLKAHPGQFAGAGSVVFAGPEGIAVRKNEAALFQAIQTAFKQVKAAGTYHQLILKWGLTNEELTAGDRRVPGSEEIYWSRDDKTMPSFSGE